MTGEAAQTTLLVRLLPLVLGLTVALAAPAAPAEQAPATYVGSEECIACHEGWAKFKM